MLPQWRQPEITALQKSKYTALKKRNCDHKRQFQRAPQRMPFQKTPSKRSTHYGSEQPKIETQVPGHSLVLLVALLTLLTHLLAMHCSLRLRSAAPVHSLPRLLSHSLKSLWEDRIINYLLFWTLVRRRSLGSRNQLSTFPPPVLAF